MDLVILTEASAFSSLILNDRQQLRKILWGIMMRKSQMEGVLFKRQQKQYLLPDLFPGKKNIEG